ncbi:cupin domain-containing protein [Chitinimonas lacunae]|uniref:Cupin domain-containing protein n=1 Tax=Chitinimonas lacunae TaxID=1963018 RepID=A0ABV8MNR5_9NEIS
MPSLISFSQAIEPVYSHPREDRRLHGNPQRTTWSHFQSDDGLVDAGVWACEVGSWRIAFPAGQEEFFTVLSGRVRLHDEQGKVSEVGPGEALLIPAGFTGVFEVVEPVRKYYVIVQRNLA